MSSLEITKDGSIIQVHLLNSHPFYVVGRQPPETKNIENFLLFEHPSLSRKHAVLQLSQTGHTLSVYDLGSTHGTFVNKKPIKPRTYVPLRDGDLLQFAESSRMVWVH